MAATNYPSSSEIADLQTTTVIKEEEDVDHTITEDMPVDIKPELSIDDSTIEENRENPFKNVHLQVKQERICLSLEKEGSDSLNDSIPKMDDSDNDSKDFENYATVAKCEMDCDDKSEVKEERVGDESIVTYDYPNFDDVASLDSNDAAALTHVEACLQDGIGIKCEDDGHFEVSYDCFFCQIVCLYLQQYN